MKFTVASRISIVAAGLAMLCSIGWAQGLTGTPQYVQSVMAAAQQFGPRPLVPATLTPPAHRRPHVWMSGIPGSLNCSSHFCPASLGSVYGISPVPASSQGGAGIVIAIVDAFFYANAFSDFHKFNTDMGLEATNPCPQVTYPPSPSSTCTFSQKHFGTGTDSGWEVETMLDIEYAHAMAPNAQIILVEGSDNEDSNLNIAVTEALTNGHADILSQSFGESEFSQELSEDSTFNVAKTILASSGDDGAPTSYPCASPYVTCVGGTTLHATNFGATAQRTTETGWSGSGGGCSAFEPAQSYQTGFSPTSCVRSETRATPDVAAIADPNPGVEMYDSGNGGYFAVGGTSVASPVTAGLLAAVDGARIVQGPPAKAKFGQINSVLYSNAAPGYPSNHKYTYIFFDVTSGNNGFPAGVGYDLVTGLGVSNVIPMANYIFGLWP